MYDGYKALVANVFNKAVSDYKELLQMQKKEKFDEEQKELIQCEIKGNERFFHSEWAKDLADYLKIAYNPKELISKLKQEAE